MDLDSIDISLDSSDPQQKMKAIRGLNNYDPEVAVPRLKANIRDREFLVRSFIAMGLGKQQSAESFATLLEMMKFDSDPNVRAEAANSLSLFGSVAVSHLALMFEQDAHWLVRRSIIAALSELHCTDEFFEVCVLGLQGEDQSVIESCIYCLGSFADTAKETAAIEKLLLLTDDEYWRTRMQAARALGKFNNERAIAALNKLKEDLDHRVVGAVLESTV